MRAVYPGPTAILAVSVLLAVAVRTAPAEEEAAAPAHVHGVVYEVFHGDSIHRMGIHVREIHLPDRGFSFFVSGGELHVIRPDPLRYAMEGDTFAVPDPSGEGELELPILILPGLETRRIGEVRVRAVDADRLEELLRARTRLRSVADGYLLERGDFQGVVALNTSNLAAGRFVCDLLDAEGILWIGISNAGGDVFSVPAVRAEEARTVLRDELAKGLRRAAALGEIDPRIDYAVLGVAGAPEWLHDRTKVPPTPPGVCVFEHVIRFPGSEVVTGENLQRTAKYGDLKLEQAQEKLAKSGPRRWTVDLLKSWYAATKDEPVRAAFVYVLAASRNVDALALVGAALSDEQLEVRVAATHGILTYWDARPMADGGTEQAMEQARGWWAAYRASAQR